MNNKKQIITILVIVCFIICGIILILNFKNNSQLGATLGGVAYELPDNKPKYPEDTVIQFQDKGIEKAVKFNYDELQNKEKITQEDLKQVYVLDAYAIEGKLNYINTLDDLKYFPNLQSLTLSLPTMKSLEAIQSDTITSITIEGPNLSDIDSLKELKNLKSVMLRCANLENINGLIESSSIDYVILENCDSVKSEDLQKLIDKKVTLNISGSR